MLILTWRFSGHSFLPKLSLNTQFQSRGSQNLTDHDWSGVITFLLLSPAWYDTENGFFSNYCFWGGEGRSTRSSYLYGEKSLSSVRSSFSLDNYSLRVVPENMLPTLCDMKVEQQDLDEEGGWGWCRFFRAFSATFWVLYETANMPITLSPEAASLKNTLDVTIVRGTITIKRWMFISRGVSRCQTAG